MHVCSIFLWKHQVNLNIALYQSLYGSEFTHEQMINYALWTISFEVFGSYLVFSILGIIGGFKIDIISYFVLLIFMFNTNYYFFIVGLILSRVYSKSNHVNIKYPLFIFLYAIGIILITYPYPRDGVQIGWIYKYISFSDNWGLNYSVFLKIGCTIIFSCVLFDEKIKKILSNRLSLFLGKISFPIYLLHVTVISTLSDLFTHNTFHEFIILTFSTIFISIIISVPFEIFIDKKAISISNLIANKLIPSKIDQAHCHNLSTGNGTAHLAHDHALVPAASPAPDRPSGAS